MRTTLTIDDELIVVVKKLAAEEGRSVSAVVSDALRRFVNSPNHESERSPFLMPTFKGTGSDRGIDTQPGEFRSLEEADHLDPFQP